MQETGKAVGMAILIILIALFAGLVVPDFFSQVLANQGPGNNNMFRAMRALIMVFVIAVVGLSYGILTGGSNNV